VSGKAYLFWQTDQPPGCSSTMKLILYLIHWLIRCEAFFLSRQEIRLASLESGEAMTGPHRAQPLHGAYWERGMGLRQTWKLTETFLKERENLGGNAWAQPTVCYIHFLFRENKLSDWNLMVLVACVRTSWHIPPLSNLNLQIEPACYNTWV
jgi:hypothetical protein